MEVLKGWIKSFFVEKGDLASGGDERDLRGLPCEVWVVILSSLEVKEIQLSLALVSQQMLKMSRTDYLWFLLWKRHFPSSPLLLAPSSSTSSSWYDRWRSKAEIKAIIKKHWHGIQAEFCYYAYRLITRICRG